MKRKTIGYAVHYCDHGGLDVAYSFDPDVTGGVCCRGIKEPVAVFPDRASAARAIRISELAARLARERGEIANDDFLGSNRENIRIVRLEAAEAEQPKKAG